MQFTAVKQPLFSGMTMITRPTSAFTMSQIVICNRIYLQCSITYILNINNVVLINIIKFQIKLLENQET